MDDIVIRNAGGGHGSNVDGHLERMTVGEPQPGTYWRSKRDLPDQMRERAEPDTFSRNGGVRTWVELARAVLPEGTLLLLRSTRKVDGRVHTLVTAGEPSIDGDPPRAWLLDEFLDAFEPVHEEEAARDRSVKIAATMSRIAEIQADMVRIASSTSDAALALPSPSQGLGRDMTPTSLTEARERVQAATSVIKVRAESIQEANRALGAETSRLVALHTEKTSAAAASVQDALALADAANRAAETLDVFGGKKVQVIPIRDGVEAPEGTPLTIYQNRLFLDEEIALFLHRDGFDHKDIQALPAIVAKHPLIVDRMIPALRGVALVRIRRGKKSYFGKDAGLAEILQEIGMQALDTEQFLMIRDGERLHLVFVETALQEAERLFPTVDEMDRPFKGAGGAEKIGFDDTRYVKALDEFERQALLYKRLLILLWGLQFNDARPIGHVGAPGESPDWYSLDWQGRNFVFVGDDATRSLPDARLDIRDWLRANMEMLQSGSRVLVDWGRALVPESAPSCASYHDERTSEAVVISHRPGEDYSLHTVRSDGGSLIVDVQVWKRWIGKGRDTFKAKVNLSNLQDSWPPAFLVLDALDPDDFDRYMDSRISRVHYLDYMGLFGEARKALAGEFSEIRRIDGELTGRLAAILPAIDAATVRKAAGDAHRMWRAEHGGEIPRESSLAEIVAAAALIATSTPTPEAISEIAGVPLATIVSAGVTGRGRLAVTLPGPFDPLTREDAWVVRKLYGTDRKGQWGFLRETEGTVRRAVDPSVAVRVEGRVADFVHGSRLPAGISRPSDSEDIRSILSGVTPETVMEAHLASDSPGRLLTRWLDESRRLTFDARPAGAERSGVIHPHSFTILAAVADLRGYENTPSLSYLLATSDTVARILLSDPGMESRIGDALALLYKNGGRHVLDAALRRADAARGDPMRLMEFRLAGWEVGTLARKTRSANFDYPWDLNRFGDERLGYDALVKRLALRPRSRMAPGSSGYSFWEDAPDMVAARLVVGRGIREWLEGLSDWGDRPSWFAVHDLPPLAGA